MNWAFEFDLECRIPVADVSDSRNPLLKHLGIPIPDSRYSLFRRCFVTHAGHSVSKTGKTTVTSDFAA